MTFQRKIYRMAWLAVALWVMALQACRQEEELLPVAGTGFMLTLADEVTLQTRQTPAEIGGPVATDFNIHILETTTGVGKDVAYTNELIPASIGSYTLTATCGTDAPLALDAPYYKGTASAEITEADPTPRVTIPCRVANALLSVRYVLVGADGTKMPGTERFEKFFSSYGVKVTVGRYSVNLDNNTVASAYFPAGSTVSLQFHGTLREPAGKEITYDIPEPTGQLFSDIAAGNHVIVTLSYAPVETGVGLNVEKVEVENVTIKETIPLEWLPAPKLTGFADGSKELTYTETEGEFQAATIGYTTSQPLQDMVFTLNFADENLQSLNGTYQLSTMTDEQKSALSAAHIQLPAIGSDNGTLDFRGLTPSLLTNAGAEVRNEITVKVQANERWSTEETYAIRVVKPEFSVSVYPGNLWTKEFTVNEFQVTSGNIDKLNTQMVYQFSEDGSTWENLDDDLRKDGLTPNTNYYVRALYRGAVSSDVLQVKTYPIIELENGDMETWTYVDGPTASWPDRGPFWKQWYLRNTTNESTEGWCSLNALTVSDNDPKAYVSNSGTERSTIMHTGSYAAEIKTIGWGSGTTAASPISTIKNITPGELFLGKMNGTTPVYGYMYQSKPTSLRFYYKYEPDGDHTFRVEISLYNGDDIIAQNVFDGGTTVSGDFEEKNMEFEYDSSKVQIEISNISIRFISGDNSRSEVDDASVSRGSRHVGNILYIDDVELIYDK